MARFNIDKAKAAGYSDQEINEFLDKHPDLKEGTLHKVARVTAENLPLAGAVGVPAAAALTTGGLSLPATAGLAGVGGAGGEAFKQLALRALGEKSPTTSAEAATDIGVEGVKDAAATAVLGALGSKVAGVGKTLTAPSVEGAKAAQGAFEKGAGILMEELPTDLPKSASQINQFANSMKKVADKGADALSETIEPEGLQGLRKRIQVLLNSGTKIGPEAEKFLVNSKETIEKALEQSVPGYAEVRSATKAAYDKEALLDSLVSKAKTAAKYATHGAIGYGGYRALRDILGR